jgi:hypothetical protein
MSLLLRFRPYRQRLHLACLGYRRHHVSGFHELPTLRSVGEKGRGEGGSGDGDGMTQGRERISLIPSLSHGSIYGVAENGGAVC